MPRSFELMYGGVVNIEGKEGIAFVVMLLLTLVPALGPFFLDIVSRRHGDALALAAAYGQALTAGSPARAQGLCATQPLVGASASGKLKSTLHPRQLHAPRNHPSRSLPSRRTKVLQMSKPRPARPRRTAACPCRLKQDLPARDTGHLPSSNQPVRRTLPAAAHPYRCDCGASRRLRTDRTGQGDQDRASRSFSSTRRPPGLCSDAGLGRGHVRHGVRVAPSLHDRRVVYGWPNLAQNVFGKEIKSIVEARGGRKRKSSSQFYDGVSVPPCGAPDANWTRRRDQSPAHSVASA